MIKFMREWWGVTGGVFLILLAVVLTTTGVVK